MPTDDDKAPRDGVSIERLADAFALLTVLQHTLNRVQGDALPKAPVFLLMNVGDWLEAVVELLQKYQIWCEGEEIPDDEH